MVDFMLHRRFSNLHSVSPTRPRNASGNASEGITVGTGCGFIAAGGTGYKLRNIVPKGAVGNLAKTFH